MFIEQESVSALLERRGWFSDREDFSVMLQSSPVHIDLSDPVSLDHSEIILNRPIDRYIDT